MTALLLHGLVAGDAPKPDDASPHQRVRTGDLAAIATPAPPELLGEDCEAPVNQALIHHKLLSSYALVTDTLPIRFGTAFSDACRLATALKAEEAAFRATFKRLSGKVEYLLSLASASRDRRADPQASVSPPENGRDFLARKRAGRDELRAAAARRAAFAGDLAADLQAHVVDFRQIVPVQCETLAAYSLLVDRAGSERLLLRAHDLAERAASLGLALSLRGPGPCYSFAESRCRSDEYDDGTIEAERTDG